MSEDWQARFALMDTMTDIVANTLGAVIGGIVLKIALRKNKRVQSVTLVTQDKDTDETEIKEKAVV